MSQLDQILMRIESRPGAKARISATLAQMNNVLELAAAQAQEAQPGRHRTPSTPPYGDHPDSE